ncbi:hypothetical protein LUQ84_001535 [Hamiltosporidium tvaerminnensis]|nr:hypothetical protein LUQ84_001535 [Hamiltosporidium tvaerminnensis]
MAFGVVLKQLNIEIGNHIRLILFLLAAKIISMRIAIAIHFYENSECSLPERKIYNPFNSAIDLESPVKKYKSFIFDPNTKILHTFLIDLDMFFLTFLNEEEIQEDQQHIIYINNNLLSLYEFDYFYRIVISFPYFVDYVDVRTYQLIFKIMNIFKFKKNKFFQRFIQFISVSLIFNPLVTKKWNLLLTSDICSHSSVLSKKIIVEFFKLHFMSDKTFNKIKNISHAADLTEDFDIDLLTPNQDFLYLDGDIIQKIIEKSRNSTNIIKLLDAIFRIHIFKSVCLFNISYTKEYNKFFNLHLFKNLDEIFLLECSNTDVLIGNIYNGKSLNCIKTLSIINSKFAIKDEISWLKTLNFEVLNYVDTKRDFFTLFTAFESDSSVQSIVSIFKKEIYNKENESTIFYKNMNKTCCDHKTRIHLKSNQDKTKINKFKNQSFPFELFVYMELSNSFISLNFYVLNFKKIRGIEIEFTNTYINDFNLLDSEIFNNIVGMKLVNSTISEAFMSKILLFTSLRKLFLYSCTIVFEGDRIAFSENTQIKKIFFGVSCVKNNQNFFQFLNKIVELKELIVLCFAIDTNPFWSMIDPRGESLCKLSILRYSVKYNLSNAIFKFPLLPNLLNLYFGYEYPEGTLLRFFLNNHLNNLKKIKLDRIKIGKMDRQALGNFTNLLYFYFSDGCIISEISFSDLFDFNNEYSLKKIRFPKIELTYRDLCFISNLKSLRNVYFESLELKNNSLYFFKTFSGMKKIEIGNIQVFRNKFNEEFGAGAKRSHYQH